METSDQAIDDINSGGVDIELPESYLEEICKLGLGLGLGLGLVVS